MEIGLLTNMPTYSGGLGVLAGDTLRAAADLGVPMVGVTLLYRKGYFHQHLDDHGVQTESPSEWDPETFLELLPHHCTVVVEGREVHIRAWRYLVQGASGATVPVYFLDTALPENAPEDQALTDSLYGGDARYRLCQEMILGIGGAEILRELGHTRIHAYHMNEGHAALLTIPLLEEALRSESPDEPDSRIANLVRHFCVFTTHTPIPAGQDQFPIDLALQVLGENRVALLQAVGACRDGNLNMTHLALLLSRYVNGVSMRHEEVSQDMFPNYPIDSISNGVNAVTWTSPSFARLYDVHIPKWRQDNFDLRYAVHIPLDEIMDAHGEAKHALLDVVQQRTGETLSPSVFTIGFARRATPYKRVDFLFSDLERLQRIVQRVGPIQVVYGGKAHPRDEGGKTLIQRVFEAGASLRASVSVVYLEDYDIALGRVMCGGVDLWLNTPQKPLEASGTSGMKAALNGVPSLSILDGWWIEGHVEGVTGWSISDYAGPESRPEEEIMSLYDKLEFVILPLYYERPLEFAKVMRSCVALNGSFFNAQRMVLQYVENAYRPLAARFWAVG
ncbi:MAG: alpha-glucan family phosphorylase [Chloroflexi bacterium]|nr:alpha-glucan family phosphorylase [Chloroflexota bacterium]